MTSSFREKCKNHGVSPVIGVILVVAIVVILAAIIGTIMFGFTDQLDGGSSNAAFELNEQDSTITPIQTDNGTEYDVIVDGNKTKTIPGNSVGKAIQIDNASSGSNVQIVNPEKDQVVQEWKIDDETNIGNGGGDNGGNNGAGFSGDGLVLTVDTTNSADGSETNDTTFAIRSGNGNEYNVSWSEGNITGASGKTNVTWSNPGTYQVEITGGYTHPQFYESSTGNFGDAPKIESINQWGDIQYDSMNYSLAGATNLTYNANDKPDLSNVQSMLFTFAGADSFNGDISNWNTSNVKYMAYTFRAADSFNQDISNWDTSNVEFMIRMFLHADNFNQDISSWNVSNVKRMKGMFSKASSFDQNLNSWDTSSVTDMSFMFFKASSFNGDISNWNTSSVTNMRSMFWNASSFNQDISSWCVSQISERPTDFDLNAGFEGETTKQPNWGASC